MNGILSSLVTPAIWAGLLIGIVSIIVHVSGGIFATVTSGAYLEAAKTVFLFAIAAGVLSKHT
ncbi:MAG: hypothetical protein QF593_08965 [Nitrospinota bacterium]|nr:hypothetical protein [Nitrospinota bacterium]